MKKLLVVVLSAIIIFSPATVLAQDLVKEIPKKYRKIFGKNYILVDLNYLSEIDSKASKLEVVEKTLGQIRIELNKFKGYSASLEMAVEEYSRHSKLLNDHIDAQEKIIKKLGPTAWDRHKFAVGILLGGVLIGGTTYGLSKLD